MQMSNTTPRTVGFNLKFIGSSTQVLDRKMIHSALHFE